LASSTFSSPQRFGDSRRASSLSSQRLQGPHMICCPGAACRYFLSHQTTPDFEEWPLCIWTFPQRKAQSTFASSLLITDSVATAAPAAKPQRLLLGITHRQHPLNHQPISLFLCFASLHLVRGYEAKRTHGATNGEKAEMARRQIETTYLRAVLIWLQAYWAE